MPSKCYVYFSTEPQELLDLFFSMPPISMKKIKGYMNALNELQTNFYFIQNSNLDIDVEEKAIKRLLKGIQATNEKHIEFAESLKIKDKLSRAVNDISFDDACENNNGLIVIEKALYRLFLLGEIGMWSMVYSSDISNPTITHLKCTTLTEEEKLNRLKSHIEKYETNFKFTEENTFENRLKFLLNWTKENYLQERIQTLKTLYEQCVSFTDSDGFMTFISNYFSNDPIYMRLVAKNVTLKEWIVALKTHPKKTKERIARLLESYDKIVPLNYVSGVTRLMLDEFDNVDGRRRLNLALESVALFPDEDRDFLFRETIQLLNEEQRELFVECWLNYSNQDAFKIYDLTHSKVCEKYLIIDFVNNLVKIGEEIDDRL